MTSEDVQIVTSEDAPFVTSQKAVIVTSQDNVEVIATREDEDCSVALVQTNRQKNNFRTQALFGTSPNNRKSPKVVDFRGKPATPKSDMTYRTLNDATLREFYGRETPYGTVQRFDFNRDEFDDVSALATTPKSPKSPRRRVTSVSSYHSLSSPGSSPKQQRDQVFATLIRARVGGVRQVEVGGVDEEGNSLMYVDFLPLQTRKGGFSIGGYEPFT